MAFSRPNSEANNRRPYFEDYAGEGDFDRGDEGDLDRDLDLGDKVDLDRVEEAGEGVLDMKRMGDLEPDLEDALETGAGDLETDRDLLESTEADLDLLTLFDEAGPGRLVLDAGPAGLADLEEAGPGRFSALAFFSFGSMDVDLDAEFSRLDS